MRLNPSLRRFWNRRTLWAIAAIGAFATLLNLAVIWGGWAQGIDVAETLRRIASAWMRRPVGMVGAGFALVAFYASTCAFLAALLAVFHDDAWVIARPAGSGLLLAALMLLQVRLVLLPMPPVPTPGWNWIGITCMVYGLVCVALMLAIRWMVGRPSPE